MVLQSKIDAENLVEILNIIEKHGYPRVEDVGYELANVVWLVLHHQSDLSLRDRYEKLIEENCSSGQVKAFKWRSEEIRLALPVKE